MLELAASRSLFILNEPSVMQTTRGISASTASRIPAAAKGGGTKMTFSYYQRLRCCDWTSLESLPLTLALAPVCFTPSLTFLNTGRSRCVEPAWDRNQHMLFIHRCNAPIADNNREYLFGICAAHDLCAILDRLSGVESSLLAGETLEKHFRI